MIAIKNKKCPRYCAECFVDDCPHRSGAATRLVYQHEYDKPVDCPLVEIEEQQLSGDCVVEDLINQVNEQDKWLSAAGYNAYNIDIAFKSIVKAIKNAHIRSTSKESEHIIDHKDHRSQGNQLPEDLYEDYIFMMTEKAALQEKLNEIKKVIETHESEIPVSCVKQVKRIVEE